VAERASAPKWLPRPAAAVEPSTPSIGAVARLAIAEDVARLIAHDPVARQAKDPEGVHQARVATRRLRSHLGTFLPILRTAPTERLRAELRWLGRAFGSVRDLDVLFLSLTDDFAVGLEAGAPDGSQLLSALDRERQAATARLISQMQTSRYRRLLADLGEQVASPPFRVAAGLPAELFLEDALHIRFDALSMGILALPTVPVDAELHQIRILAKPTRYAAEKSGPILGQVCVRFAKRLSEFADELGALNDASNAIAWLTVAADQEPCAEAAGWAVERESARMASVRSTWERKWAKVMTPARQMGWA
jgi:CHAD domain-containing protein